MKWLILLLSCGSCFGQAFSFADPTVASWGGVVAAAAGGGSPGVESAIVTNKASATTASVSITSTGANRVLFIGPNGYSASSAVWVTNVTVGGNNATLITSSKVNFYDGTQTNTLWYFINPPSGANTVTAQWSGTYNTFSMGVLAMTNVHQTTPVGTAVTVFQPHTLGGRLGITNTITGSSTDTFIDDVGEYFGSVNINVGPGQTIWFNDLTAAVTTTHGSSKAGSASTTMIWTNTASQDWSSIAVAVHPP